MSAKVVIYKWELGILKAIHHEFDLLEHAVEFFEKHIEKHIEHECKVFDHHGHLIHCHDHHHHDGDYC